MLEKLNFPAGDDSLKTWELIKLHTHSHTRQLIDSYLSKQILNVLFLDDISINLDEGRNAFAYTRNLGSIYVCILLKTANVAYIHASQRTYTSFIRHGKTA